MSVKYCTLLSVLIIVTITGHDNDALLKEMTEIAQQKREIADRHAEELRPINNRAEQVFQKMLPEIEQRINKNCNEYLEAYKNLPRHWWTGTLTPADSEINGGG
jgi:hypothetical protein